ncbi:MAG: hypothetical protein A3F31_03305 [Candidatus Levybacteria bacterium RIFCSPHIGHO2_12_FULL_38_12]|nr:MAG: hypothetical protein A2770_03730 [Candidatus Levybacteria bacterium RIFCSPHIGHO2_01_FULL_38_12]OGH22127.1 MAG: hypothetical protein A3D75_02675 [Candidatus Levybacteria bacterium RIFCSPHIGHO2_02_FULL_37_18]OGH22974.1 MAG: hypothetical protein A3F31_03305 [Candidatus Levybacteria bacterium RIFCSPHIGHO2_12_FULL_38_12]OGH34145.1 MAG: hypothetical protein A3A47_03435 [Candidatus Levybacteria bacterium RIFCSPLOWO2_01_FULL_37_20]OGH44938.1 MAG: hypothetical protein A3J14_01100 [Candidatus Lev
MINEERIREELRTIIDPELGINIVDLGLIYDVGIVQNTGEVEIIMTLTSPGCPLSMVFEDWVPAAVKRVPGVQNARINLVWEPAWNPDKISEEAKEELGIIQ